MYFKTCLSSSKMKVNSQVTISKRFLIIILVALFALSAINTFLIFERTSGPPDTSAVNYDYVVSQDGSGCLLKNMLTGSSTTVPTSLSYAINILMSEGKSVYINPGTYTLTQDVLVANKINAKIVSDGAIVIGNGHQNYHSRRQLYRLKIRNHLRLNTHKRNHQNRRFFYNNDIKHDFREHIHRHRIRKHQYME